MNLTPGTGLLAPPWLVCPICREPLAAGEGDPACESCGAGFCRREEILDLTPPGAASAQSVQQAEYFDEESDDHEINRPYGTPGLHGWLLAEKFRRGVRGLEDMLVGATALTVCGGSGMDAEFLARAGARVVCSDISPGAVARARERGRRHGVEITPLIADVERLPFADRSFDLVWVHDGLHHLEDPRRGIAEMARVARLAVSINEPARATATALAVRLGIALEREEAGNRVARLDPGVVAAQLHTDGLRVLGAERYAMYYGHRPGVPARLLSRGALLPLAQRWFQAFNAILGGIGNKLSVRAIRAG